MLVCRWGTNRPCQPSHPRYVSPGVSASPDDVAYAAEDAEVAALAAGGDSAGARRRLAAFVTRHPASAEAHNDLGVLAYQAGELPAALAALARAVALRSDCARYHRNQALVLLASGDAPATVAALGRAMDLDPADAETQRVLGDVTAAFAAASEQARRAANKQYWSGCTDTRLASPEYYRRARAALNERLPSFLPAGARLIDLGCGDGEAALDAAPHCSSVLGYDVSAALVNAAAARARGAGLSHVRFQTIDLEGAELPALDADALLCLGVISCLPDDAASRVVGHLGRSLRAGALLVLRETVSRDVRRDVVYDSGYCGRYRPIESYLGAVIAAGFTLREDIPLTGPQGSLENHLWFFERAG